MGFELRIHFAGVCAFTPRREGSKIAEMVVSLIDTEKGKKGKKRTSVAAFAPQMGGLPRHALVVQYSLKNRFSDEPRHPLFTGRHGSIQGLWLLDREDVEIRAVGGDLGGPLDVDETPLENGATPTEENAASFHWISPLYDASGQVTELDKKICDPQEKPRAAVGARVFLRHGRLRPANFHLDETGEKYALWDLGNGKLQAITTVVRHTIQVRGSLVRLVAGRYRDGKKRYLTLKPSSRRDEDFVEIWMMSREAEAIARQSVPRPVPKNETMEPWATELDLVHDLAAESAAAVTGQGERSYPKWVGSGGTVPMRFRRLDEVPESDRFAFMKPCHDQDMRHIFFQDYAGEVVTGTGCSPIRTGP
jgi:hypothetical protein